MELYAAIDLHSNNSVLVMTDAEDRVMFAKRLYLVLLDANPLDDIHNTQRINAVLLQGHYL